MRTAALLAVSLVAAALSGGPSQAASLEMQPRPLTRATTLIGDSPAKVRVSLPSPATVQNPLAGGRGVNVVGDGDFVGFALVERTSEGPGAVLVGGRLPRSAGNRLFVLNAGFIADSTVSEYELAAGTYDLILLPGTGTARVTIYFGGLKGRSVLRSSQDVAFRAAPLEQYASDAAATIQAAGGVGKIVEDGLLFQTAWFSSDGHAATSYDACLWRGAPRQPWAALPRCGDSAAYEPQGNIAGHGTIDYGSSLGEEFHFYYGAWTASSVAARDGTFGQSFTLQSASAIENLDSMALWLSFGR